MRLYINSDISNSNSWIQGNSDTRRVPSLMKTSFRQLSMFFENTRKDQSNIATV